VSNGLYIYVPVLPQYPGIDHHGSEYENYESVSATIPETYLNDLVCSGRINTKCIVR
jgi:hypothetical protein